MVGKMLVVLLDDNIMVLPWDLLIHELIPLGSQFSGRKTIIMYLLIELSCCSGKAESSYDAT